MRAHERQKQARGGEVFCTATATSRDAHPDAHRLLLRITARGVWAWCKWCREEHLLPREEVITRMGAAQSDE